MIRALIRWRYRLLGLWDRGDDLNRRVVVENKLWQAAASGKGLTPDECRKMAVKLGVPSWANDKGMTKRDKRWNSTNPETAASD